MPLDFIPEVQELKENRGHFSIPRKGIIAICDAALKPIVDGMAAIFPHHPSAVAVPEITDSVRILLNPEFRNGEYHLEITGAGVRLEAASLEAAFHGVQTLHQVAQQSPKGKLRHVTIRDWPDFPLRGLYYDVARGRVPNLDSLKRQADWLARYKLNHLQYYIEHTFAFRRHPDIGRNCGRLTPEEILEIDAYCAERHIEFTPSLASFGHMSRILEPPQYHHLAEDRGRGEFEVPESELPYFLRKCWTIVPGLAESYQFLDSLWEEFLPLFRSNLFNVCCDETYDLGCGQSHKACQQRGKGRVYLDHLLRLSKMAAHHGRKMMFWGDIIHHYPELIPEIPKDVTVLDWGYGALEDFEKIAAFKAAGCPFIACPGVSAYESRSIFLQMQNVKYNIARYAQAARKHGALGILTTDWGSDHGQEHFMEYSVYGYLLGAEKSWKVDSDLPSFTRRFCKLFLRCESKELVAAMEEFFEIASRHWMAVFFAREQDPEVRKPRWDGYTNRKGEPARFYFNAKLGGRMLERFRRISSVFASHRRKRGVDPEGILPYWIFAADAHAHAARKLTILGDGGRETAVTRRSLGKEMSALMKRFQSLWLDRNKRSEIGITLKRYRRAINSLK